MSQAKLAEALGVSRSAVNAWENDRALPQSSLGALEAVLHIRLYPDDGGPADAPAIPASLERALDKLTPAERAYVIRRLRQQPGDGGNEVPE